MSILTNSFNNLAVNVIFTKDTLHCILADGREISAPLKWFPKLWKANQSVQNNWRLIGKGVGIHWPDLDEDISISSLMHIED